MTRGARTVLATPTGTANPGALGAWGSNPPCALSERCGRAAVTGSALVRWCEGCCAAPSYCTRRRARTRPVHRSEVMVDDAGNGDRAGLLLRCPGPSGFDPRRPPLNDNERRMMERINGARGDEDESGFVLTVETDEEDYRFRVTDVASAHALLSAVSRLRPWIAERNRERAAFDRASPEERARVIDGSSAVVLDAHDDLLDAADGRS